MNTAGELTQKGQQAKEAARKLSYISTTIKNTALIEIAGQLHKQKDYILDANSLDYSEAKENGMDDAMLDRLLLTTERIDGMAQDVGNVASLSDPVGEIFDMRTLPNGLRLGKKRVPIGVIATIYESRPNVTIDIASLCLKAGNAVILRGGKETLRSNRALTEVIRQTLTKTKMPVDAVQLIENTDRALVYDLLKMRDVIDLIIPRGGAGLIKFVRDNSQIPVVAGGIGVCHTFVDTTADIEKASHIIFNAKVQRPTVCNALDTVLIHQDIATSFLPLMAQELNQAGVELRCDQSSLEILRNHEGLRLVSATSEDWGKEFLSLILAVKVVESLDMALEHIARYGSGHTEAILSENHSNTERFLNEVDAASVMVNTSTRYTDGAQFGLGAEVGISTQKMHARGPLGLKEITSYKWLVYGDWQVRP
ncbi:MAG: glutamate-5-semialdehyde dehydrogenase [Dehalococcoidia bacterium]|nr:glutamate-5-semialdehyde dehydrogenase [Dehalococcoidia bacterium]